MAFDSWLSFNWKFGMVVVWVPGSAGNLYTPTNGDWPQPFIRDEKFCIAMKLSIPGILLNLKFCQFVADGIHANICWDLLRVKPKRYVDYI